MPKNLYEFVATGQGDVIKAYESIGAAAVRQKKVVEETARATAKARGGGAGGTTGGRGQSAEDRRHKEAERAAAKYERELQREVRATQQAEARKRAVEQRSAQARERQDRAMQARRERAAERSASAERRAQERAQKHVAGIKERHFRDEQKKAEQREQAAQRATAQATQRQARAQKQAAARAAQANKAEQRESSKRYEQAASIVGGIALGGAISAVALGGAASKDALALDETARRIAVNARKSGGPLADITQLRQSFQSTALATPGVKSEDIADAVQRFISLTGDFDTAMKGQGVFATVASATGAGVGDVAEATASLSQQFDIKSLDDMRESLAALTFQGKEGAFELKDAAAQFQRLAASGAAFGIPKGVQGVKTLGGLTQIARTGTGSAEQAATAVENLLTNLKLKQKDLGAAGVNVFDKSGQARAVPDLIVEAIAKVGGGDMGKKSAGLAKIFGEQGIRAINPLIAKYSETYRGTQGTEAEKTAAAMARLREEFEKSINAPGTWADVVEDAATAQKASSAQLTAAWESIKAGIGDVAVPAIQDLSDALGPIVKALKKDISGEDVDKVGGKGELAAAEAVVKELGEKQDRTLAEDDALAQARGTVEKHRYKKERSDLFQKLVKGGASPEELSAYGFDPSGGAGPMSTDEFIRRTAQDELGDESDPEKVDAAMARARDKAHALAGMGYRPSPLEDFLMRKGESVGQEETRNRYQVAQGGEGYVEAGRNAPSANEAASDAALQKVASSADLAAAALARLLVLQGTIFG